MSTDDDAFEQKVRAVVQDELENNGVSLSRRGLLAGIAGVGAASAGLGSYGTSQAVAQSNGEVGYIGSEERPVEEIFAKAIHADSLDALEVGDLEELSVPSISTEELNSVLWADPDTDDMGAEINALIDEANPFDKIIVPPGNHRYEETITVDKRITLSGAATPTSPRVDQYAENFDLVPEDGATGIIVKEQATIANLSIRSTQPRPDYLVDVQTNCTILNCKFHNYNNVTLRITDEFGNANACYIENVSIFAGNGTGVLVDTVASGTGDINGAGMHFHEIIAANVGIENHARGNMYVIDHFDSRDTDADAVVKEEFYDNSYDIGWVESGTEYLVDMNQSVGGRANIRVGTDTTENGVRENPDRPSTIINGGNITSGDYKKNGTKTESWEIVTTDLSTVSPSGEQFDIPDRADWCAITYSGANGTGAHVGDLRLRFNEASSYFSTYMNGDEITHESGQDSMHLGDHNNDMGPSFTMVWNANTWRTGPHLTASNHGSNDIPTAVGWTDSSVVVGDSFELFSSDDDLNVQDFKFSILDMG